MPDRTWVLVVDREHARLFKGLAPEDAAAPAVTRNAAAQAHLRDHLGDRPGRSFASDGSGRRSAMEPGSDPERHDLERFADIVLTMLEGHLAAGAFDRLAVLAGAQMLGILRAQMPPALSRIIALDRPLDLGWMSDREVRDLARDLLSTATGR